MSDTPRPSRVVKSNSIPRKNPVSTGTHPQTSSLVKHQSFIGSPKSIRKPLQLDKDRLTRRDSKIPVGDEPGSQEHTLIRYMDTDLFLRITGQTNLRLITRLDLSCPPNNPNGRKFPYIDHMDALTNLVELNLSGNALSRCDRLGKLTQLQKLYISSNKLESLDGLWPLFNLTVLDVSYNQIQKIPNYLPNKLTALRELYLSGNKLISLPDVIKLRSLTGLLHMSIAENPIARLPHCRGMIVYGIPTLELLDGDPIGEEEKAEAGGMYARETLALHESELLQLRERVAGMELEVEEALKGRERLEKSETQSRQELQVRTQENERLDSELSAQRRLVEQKTGDLNKALEGRYQLENELALYKLDYKVDDSRYTDMFLPNFAPDSESSDMEEIPYLGQARFKPNQVVHRATHRDMSQPAPYQLVPGVQYGREGAVQMPDPSDPAVLARQVYRKEQEIQTADRRLEDLRENLTRSDQNIQTCEEGRGGSPLSEEESERLRSRLTAAKEELRELKRRQQEQLDLSQIIASDEETESLIRDSQVFENANAEDLNHIAELIAEKELATREMAERMSGGEQMEMMRLESSTLTEELRKERSQQGTLVADKQQLVTLLNEMLNIEGVSVPVQTLDTGEMEALREKALELEQEMQALQNEMERLREERNELRRRSHKETAEVGVSARCYQMNQSTNTPRERPKLNMSSGSSVSIPSGEQAWGRERQGLLERLGQLGQDLAEKELVNQVLQDSIDRTALERNCAMEERDQAEEEIGRYRVAMLEAQNQIDELKRTLAAASEALERMENLEGERAALERRLREEEQERHQVEGENKSLREKASQMKQQLQHSDEARRSVENRARNLLDDLSELQDRLSKSEKESQELENYINHLNMDRKNKHTQTPVGPDFPQMAAQLQSLMDVLAEDGEPEDLAAAIQELPRPPPAQFPEERMVGELSGRLVGLLEHMGQDLAGLREQLVDMEVENADLKDLMNPLQVHRDSQTGPDLNFVYMEQELDHHQGLLASAEQELAELKSYRGVDVCTQVRPRLNNQLSQANIADSEMLLENEELRGQVDGLEGEKADLLGALEQADQRVRDREDQIQSLVEDIEQLETENNRLKQQLRTTVGVQTSDPGDLMSRRGEQPPYGLHELSAMGDDVARLRGIVDNLENPDPRQGSSARTESIDLNEFERRPPHRNVGLQANLFETESRGMQAGGTSAHTQTFPPKESLGTQTRDQGDHFFPHSPFDSPLSVSENSVFLRPPNRTEIRVPDSEGVHVKSKSTLTRKPDGTGRRKEVRDIFIDEEIIPSESDASEEDTPPLPPQTEKTTRIHYRTTRGAQTEKPKSPKKSLVRSDTELHDKIYISRTKRKHRVHRKKGTQQVPGQTSTQKTFVVFSESESESDSAHSVVESGDEADYIYVHGRHKKQRNRGTGNGSSDYRVQVRKYGNGRRPDKHYFTTDEHEYFCNVPQHIGMEEEIERLEGLLGIPKRRNRSTHVDVTVRHSLLDRLSDIERLLKDKVDRLGDKQEEQERLNHQLSREQQHLSRTAAELSRAGNELQQINLQLRGRSQRTDDITGQTSHGGMTPQLDTLQRRIEGLTGILHEAETRGNEEVADLMAKKSRIQREINQLQDELDLAKHSLEDVNERKRSGQSDFYRKVEEKAGIEDSIKNLLLARSKEEDRLRQLKMLVQDLRSVQAAPDQSGIAALEAKRHQLESQIRHLQQDVNNMSSQEETVENLRHSQNECEKLRGLVRRYKEKVRELEHQLRQSEEQRQAYELEADELRAQLTLRQDNKRYDSKHTRTIDGLLHDLQSQLCNLQENISTELYKDDLNFDSSQPPPPIEEMLPPENTDVLPDMFSMRVSRHQAMLDEINREHDSLVQILQANMQEGEKNVLLAQQETRQGVYDLKRQIEHLQTVLNQHNIEPAPDPTYQIELDMKKQNELLYQVDRKVDKLRYLTKPKATLSPIPYPQPFSSHSTNSQFDTCPLPYNSTSLDLPSRDTYYQTDPSYYVQPTDQSVSNTLKKSYDSTFDRNSPPSQLAPPDSILYEDPPSDSSRPDIHVAREPDRRQDRDRRGSPYTLPRTRDMNGSLYPTECRSHSSHSTASLLRLQVPDEHKIQLLEQRHAQGMLSRPSY